MIKINLPDRVINFLLFKNNTYLSFFSEGQRRILFLVSIFISTIIGIINQNGTLSKSLTPYWYFGLGAEAGTVAWYLFPYLLLHAVLLLIIWVYEGMGKVRPNGDAMSTFKNFIFFSLAVILVIFIIEIIDSNCDRCF
ncbi:hypothetical protein N9C25_03285 [Saprospiraceae bacterium]|nr:hypothetical protein [Saprospiraceae bacterium]